MPEHKIFGYGDLKKDVTRLQSCHGDSIYPLPGYQWKRSTGAVGFIAHQ